MNVVQASVLKTNYNDPDLHEIMEKIIKPEIELEKAGYQKRQEAIARENHRLGSQWLDSLGQKMGSVDPVTWHRWNQEVPGCWSDIGFIKMFLAANPECACKTRSF